MVSDPGRLSVEDGRVRVGDRLLQLPYPVAEARVIADRIVVLYDYMSGPRFRQFQNVEAFNPKGERLWTAQHPSNETAAVYVRFMSEEPLRLLNFAGHVCDLDPHSGRLLHAEFTK